MKARESFTATSLGLLANYRKRHQLMGLLKSLHTIKTLVCTLFLLESNVHLCNKLHLQSDTRDLFFQQENDTLFKKKKLQCIFALFVSFVLIFIWI